MKLASLLFVVCVAFGVSELSLAHYSSRLDGSGWKSQDSGHDWDNAWSSWSGWSGWSGGRGSNKPNRLRRQIKEAKQDIRLLKRTDKQALHYIEHLAAKLATLERKIAGQGGHSGGHGGGQSGSGECKLTAEVQMKLEQLQAYAQRQQNSAAELRHLLTSWKDVTEEDNRSTLKRIDELSEDTQTRYDGLSSRLQALEVGTSNGNGGGCGLEIVRQIRELNSSVESEGKRIDDLEVDLKSTQAKQCKSGDSQAVAEMSDIVVDVAANYNALEQQCDAVLYLALTQSNSQKSAFKQLEDLNKEVTVLSGECDKGISNQ